MMLWCTLTYLLPLFSTVAASPVGRELDVDCSPDSSSGLKPECWAALEMDKYITDWMAANGTAAGCDTLGFAQCYLQFNGLTTLTCDRITSSTCPPPSSRFTYSSNQHFYALWNIYAVYQFFTQYSQALSNGASLAGQTVDKIVATVAPPIEAQQPASSLMNILGSTLGVASLFTGAIPGDAGTILGLIQTGLSQALLAKKNLPETLVKPSQTADDRFIQLGDIGSSLANLVKDYQNNLLETVASIQRDHTLFTAACGQGGFSQRVTASLTIQSAQLYRQLQLFILSSALKANGIVSAKSTGVDALQFATQTDEISCTALSPGGFCNQWWLDGEGNTYSFHNPGDTRNTHIELTKTIVQEEWATLDQVFQIEDCAGKEPEFDAASLGVRCIATHGFCEWNYQPTYAETRREPQFKNCPNDPKWGYLCSSWENRLLVPESYLGPLLIEGRFGFERQDT
ncbi:uncharacterized protein J7T54_001385 [Emericellopsis cladophorae]|uniref:Cyanovirin-N domain-containing protein n=1 Tax=Emericellopsis cladophorae TaxID=2686198 RepID=A0A9P9XU84_9HYPO|nr:uncharacterized protein J7T54_001385 [Emericellopsis cladophorae]KAI6777835.1 hypothetical protein J7T54_001385 [Emericellopsis cladophorae]